MSRISALAAQPRIALGALLTMLLAAAVVVGSGANFSASSANPNNTFAAGTLEIINSKEANFILQAANMKPAGTPQVSTVDIENDGSLPGVFTLSRTVTNDSDGANPLSAKLNVTVVDCGVFVGATAPTCGDGDDVTKSAAGSTLATMATTALGTYAADEKHRYQFSVQLDGSAGNPYQGDSSTVEFDFNAVQS